MGSEAGGTPGDEAMRVPEMPRHGRLTGRTAIVTGAGSAGSRPGSGAAIAVLLASEGADVVVLDRSAERAAHTVAAIEISGGSALAAVADITDPSACTSVVDAAAARFGGVDVLVNNAAVAPAEGASSDEMWRHVFDVNLRGAKLMSDAAIPHMTARSGGSIVMISSVSAVQAGGGIAYTAAKAGMVGLAKALAHAYGRAGIRANSILPGHLALPMGLGYEGWDGSGVNMRAMRAHASLLGTEGDGWDVAYAALFLASPESGYITAATLPVDGGSSAVMPIVMHEPLTTAATSTDQFDW